MLSIFVFCGSAKHPVTVGPVGYLEPTQPVHLEPSTPNGIRTPRHIAHDVLSLKTLEEALIAGKILCYAQGFGMIEQASDAFGWALPLPAIAEVWREGCIIRSAMLDDMATALRENPDRNLMMAPRFADSMTKTHGALRQTVAQGALHGIAMPALSSGLAYFDAMRTARGTANMIQGQRDFFGAHGFARVDGGSGHHGPWGS